jgi:hypothetical protein
MSSIAEEMRAQRASTLFLARMRPALPLLAVVLAAIFLRCSIVTATDVSWLITLSEKVLDGARLYVDLIEVNPPASVLLYLPAVAFARFVGIAPEIAVNALVFLAVGVSLWVTSRILLRARLLDGIDGWTLVTFAALLLLVFPARTFAQREHIAVIVLLPALATYVVRGYRMSPGFAAATISGIGIGIAVSIKPHFALAVFFAAVAAARHAKSWRSLFALEHGIAGGVVAAYGASVFVFYPQFVSDVLPLVQAVYVPVRLSLLTILTRGQAILWISAISILAFRKRAGMFTPRYSVLLMASCGFALAFAVQAKGWPYHSYPMLTLSILALAVFYCERAVAMPKPGATENLRGDGVGSFAAMVAFLIIGFYGMTIAPNFTPLAQTIRRHAAQPKVLAISSDIGLGHPLVRQVGGRWVQSVGSLWITDNAGWLLKGEQSPDLAARLQRYAARDHAMLLEDIRREQPDIILLDANWETRARADGQLSAELRAYHEMERELGVIILQRDGHGGPREGSAGAR